jgi:amidase
VSDDLLGRSAVEQAALVRSGEISARELVEVALRAVDRLDPAVNAFVAVCGERALAEAGGVAAGDQRSLCGVPIGVKDFLTPTEGIPTSEGSHAFGDWVADHDGGHVRRLREAGAIVIGKTNTPEMAVRPVTENARFGITRSPWAPELTSGGSSGGSAAAVAAGMVALADGSDLGGSIRIPAACCGVVGLKPGMGRVSIGPDFGDVAGGMIADGVLTRTVEDTAVGLDAIAGVEPGDRRWAPPPPTGTFAAAVGWRPDTADIRLCLTAPAGVPVDEEPAAAAKDAAEALRGLGYGVSEWTPAWEDETFAGSWSTYATGTMRHLVRVAERLHGRPLDPDRLEPATRAWFLESAPVPLVDYLEAGECLWAFARRLLTDWPPDRVLVTPTLTRLPVAAGAVRAEAGVTDTGRRFSALVRIWNVTGQPAISLPLSRTAEGVPIGVQLVGAPGQEHLLIALAAQLEAEVGWPRVAPSPGE